MNVNMYTSALFVGLVVLLSACASSTKVLDDKVAKEDQVQNRTQLGAEATDLIQGSKTLTAEQKKALLTLRDSVKEHLDKYQKESIRLRSILVQDVLAAKYDDKEVNQIKDRLGKLERDRLAVFFVAIDHANKIIGGRNDIDNRDEMIEMMFPMRFGEF